MDLKLWEYIFEMFNYKIRQKKSFFSKLQTLTPPLIERFKYNLRGVYMKVYCFSIYRVVGNGSDMSKASAYQNS